MSIFWSLVNVSKGQRFTLMLCVLSLIASVQWSCHCSAETLDPIQHSLDTSSSSPGVNLTTGNSTQENNATENIGTISPKSTSAMDFIVPADPVLESKVGTDESPRHHGEKSKMQGTELKSGPPVVLISLLVLGLVCVAGLLGASYLSCKKSRTPPSRRLNEEAGAQDHDSVCFSAASEGQADKPKQNGEAQEKEKDAASTEAGEKPVKKGKEEGDTEL